jgi:two-component system sensor histidine kinase EvgS
MRQGWDTIEPLVSRVLEEMEQFNEWLAHQE